MSNFSIFLEKNCSNDFPDFQIQKKSNSRSMTHSFSIPKKKKRRDPPSQSLSFLQKLTSQCSFLSEITCSNRPKKGVGVSCEVTFPEAVNNKNRVENDGKWARNQGEKRRKFRRAGDTHTSIEFHAFTEFQHFFWGARVRLI